MVHGVQVHPARQQTTACQMTSLKQKQASEQRESKCTHSVSLFTRKSGQTVEASVSLSGGWGEGGRSVTEIRLIRTLLDLQYDRLPLVQIDPACPSHRQHQVDPTNTTAVLS